MLNFDSACKELGYDRWVCNSLERAYSGPGRHYHNLGHINAMLGHIDAEPCVSSEERASLIKATLWHDYVYKFQDTLQGENELMSAVEFCRIADGLFEPLVYKMICASGNHATDQQNAAACPTLGLFLDFDLESFAQHWEDMSLGSKNVRLELEPCRGTRSFLMGNAAFLEALLRRDSLYYVKKDWIPRARENIQRKIDEIYRELVGLPFT